MTPRLLVCCEFSQTVMSAFLVKGFDANGRTMGTVVFEVKPILLLLLFGRIGGGLRYG